MGTRPREIKINGRTVGEGQPTYIVAEMSGNHNQVIEDAIRIIHRAKESGADAVKLQTYTADTLTIDCAADPFLIKEGLWAGRTLFDLYQDAYTPWEWHERLKWEADKIGIDLFSSPFDHTAVDLLEKLDIPVYKVASFEMNDHALLRYIAKTEKPIIMSTGLATLSDIGESIAVIRSEGNEQILVLHCVSAYPAPADEMHLRTIPHLAEAFDVATGLSDHTEGIASAIGSVALGASLIEKHFTLSREAGGPDAAFSLEPDELTELVENVHLLEKALGTVHYEVKDKESESLPFRRSLFAVEDIRKGEELTSVNVRSIRPGYGLPPKHLDDIIGLKAGGDIKRGTPLSWNLLSS